MRIILLLRFFWPEIIPLTKYWPGETFLFINISKQNNLHSTSPKFILNISIRQDLRLESALTSQLRHNKRACFSINSSWFINSTQIYSN